MIVVATLALGILSFADEVKLLDADGLDTYLTYMEQECDMEEDVIMMDTYFGLTMSIFYPDANYMVYGYVSDYIPYQNVEAFTDWSQLEGVDTVWFLSFRDYKVYNLQERYDVTSALEFSYSYYDFVLEKYEIK